MMVHLFFLILASFIFGGKLEDWKQIKDLSDIQFELKK